jgi:hypothetical protein
MHASDAPSDITVHFDITGNSTTEGKMTDITACFNDRLNSIRKLIIQNSNLPRKNQEISRLLAEFSRYQGYENKASRHWIGQRAPIHQKRPPYLGHGR